MQGFITSCGKILQDVKIPLYRTYVKLSDNNVWFVFAIISKTQITSYAQLRSIIISNYSMNLNEGGVIYYFKLPDFNASSSSVLPTTIMVNNGDTKIYYRNDLSRTSFSQLPTTATISSLLIN